MLIKMPELQMDVAVANRFISSLSKSLQALCHGCMDFDSGIEIVGYINVNIDSGSKVDYVLNEKVLKSTTNSMTFVSNSFLARKEQQKQTQDGSCSPIPEMNLQPAVMSQFQNRAREYLHGIHPRNTAPISHSYGHHGSQKRSWAGMERDWRMSPKKQRGGRSSYTPHHDQSSATQGAHSNLVSSSSGHNPADASFKWPQTSIPGSDTNNLDSHPEINIKKELLESDSAKETEQNELDESQTLNNDTQDNTEQVSNVANIKSDPDASTADASDETTALGSVNESENDYKGTFLKPSISEKIEDTEQYRNQTDANDDSETAAVDPLHQPDEPAAAEEVPTENVTPGSEMPAEYDETGEEGAYAHSVYSDAGEGSSDAGQFEVIEIDDEDEDVQAMFGEPHRSIPSTSNYEPQVFAGAGSHTYGISSRAVSTTHYDTSSRRPHTFQCPNCPEIFTDGCEFKSHMSTMHGAQFPYVCSLCGKGYFSSSGLYRHIRVHKGKMTFCTICDSKFTQTSTLRRHLITVHSLMPCSLCKALFRLGVEYNNHKQHCGTADLNC